VRQQPGCRRSGHCWRARWRRAGGSGERCGGRERGDGGGGGGRACIGITSRDGLPWAALHALPRGGAGSHWLI
jgi:hypothetical protein